jgi:hypothetical protein
MIVAKPACCLLTHKTFGVRSVKVTGLGQNLGQLEAVHRDFQSKYEASLQLLGQPCNFYAKVCVGCVFRTAQ